MTAARRSFLGDIGEKTGDSRDYMFPSARAHLLKSSRSCSTLTSSYGAGVEPTG